MLAASDQAPGKAVKDHVNEARTGRYIDLEEAVETACADGFDPREDEGGTLDFSASR